MWLKATTNDTVSGSGNGWADTQVMCFNANNTQPGSRNLSEAEADKTAGVWGRTEGLGKGTFVFVGLMIVLSFVL